MTNEERMNPNTGPGNLGPGTPSPGNEAGGDRGELPPTRDAAPKPGIWRCPNCDARIQVIVDPDHTWDQPFTCVCGTPMDSAQVDETANVTESQCAHCGVLIVDESTAVKVSDVRYCCNNCAMASTRN